MHTIHTFLCIIDMQFSDKEIRKLYKLDARARKAVLDKHKLDDYEIIALQHRHAELEEEDELEKREELRVIHKSFIEYIAYAVPQYIFKAGIIDNITLYTDAKYIVRLISFLYLDHNTQSKMFTDLFGTDFLSKKYRFLLVYQLYSLPYNMRTFIKLYTDEVTWVPSIVHIIPAARWYEREVWDLYGVHFSNNGDLRRILTDYGFRGHPLRRDFPISGFLEVRYSERHKTLIYGKVRLIQEFRDFHARMPWKYFYSSVPDFSKLIEMDAALEAIERGARIDGINGSHTNTAQYGEKKDK